MTVADIERTATSSETNVNILANKVRSNSISASGHLDFLDGLRGFFAISVVVGHLAFDGGLDNSWGGGPQLGVPGFFVMSSFLITYGLHRQLDSKKPSSAIENYGILLQYAIKRILRVFPLFVLTAYIVQITRAYGEDCATFADLVSLKRSGCCFLWTIRPEIINYLYMPIYVYSIYINKLAIIPWLFWFHYAEEHLTPRLGTHDWPRFEEKIPYTWHAAFLYGSILSTLYVWLQKPIGKVEKFVNKRANGSLAIRVIISLIKYSYDAVLMYGALRICYESHPRYKGSTDVNVAKNDTAYQIGTWIFLALYASKDSAALYIFRSPLMATMGKMSYSWYLLHKPISQYMRNEYMHDWRGEEFTMTVIVLSGVVSYGSYMLFEKPVMNFGVRLCKRVEDAFGRSGKDEPLLPVKSS